MTKRKSFSLPYSLLGLSALVVLSFFLSGCSTGSETRGVVLVRGESPKPFDIRELKIDIYRAEDVSKAVESKERNLALDLNGLEERRRDLLTKLEEAGQKRDSKRSEIASLSGRLSAARGSVGRLKEELDNCEYSAFSPVCDADEIQSRLDSTIGVLNSFPGRIAAAQNVLVELEQGVSVANSNLNSIEKDISDRIKFETLFKDLPSPLSTITSAKEGRFVLEVPAGRYAVIARAKNASSGLNESFYWAFWYDASGKIGDPLELNNSNLFASDNASNLIKLTKYLEF